MMPLPPVPHDLVLAAFGEVCRVKAWPRIVHAARLAFRSAGRWPSLPFEDHPQAADPNATALQDGVRVHGIL